MLLFRSGFHIVFLNQILRSIVDVEVRMTSNRASRRCFDSLLNGLYLILDERWSSRCSLPEILREAGQAGVKLVQYRNKTGSMKQVYEIANTLREIANELGIAFMVNDRCH